MISPENLKNMIRISGYTFHTLSDATGISYPMLRAVANRQSSISADKLAVIADILGCSTDYLLGRVSYTNDELFKYMSYFKKQVIEDGYAGHAISELKQPAYKADKRLKSLPPIAVWPYNLLLMIFETSDTDKLDKELKIPISEDQTDGLSKAIDTLELDEKDVILSVYRDGFTFEKVGAKYRYSKERAKQVEIKAIRKLRYLSNKNLIIYGLNGCEERHNCIVTARIEKADDIEVATIGLSMRAVNCLDRCSIATLGELIAFINKKGRSWWTGIRNMGDGTRKEIEKAVERTTGMSDADLFRKRAG